MDVPILVNQQDLTNKISAQTQGENERIIWEQWTIGMDEERERESQGNPC